MCFQSNCSPHYDSPKGFGTTVYRASMSRNSRNVSSLSLEKGPRDLGLFKSPYLTRLWDHGLRLFEVQFLIVIFASQIFKILQTMLTKRIFFRVPVLVDQLGLSLSTQISHFDLPRFALLIPFLNYHLKISTLLVESLNSLLSLSLFSYKSV